ncbi:CRISPR-associated helicase Cas3' [Neobittarella massiliensis]|uniref:CRISPR-associated helicase Cas3 n=1 Tax=Neobittarella massiliensis (ex Bilen et al. 2018) TaxID=2041842 RepID=A0A8J6LWM3_9FIRM|nr:CRISPR-associated helicase Cas3' [Neobittarella massiliensis]MBC3517365.1 CRISPR-associated helicase Cas3' [Neobittarella massiliensis]
MYVAHKSPAGRIQTLAEHLQNTAQLACSFAADFDMAPQAELVGLAHDIGKYSQAFQRRILENGPKVDHSTAGAKVLDARRLRLLGWCVAGHHTGLPDFGTAGDMPDRPTLQGRLKRQVEDYSAFAGEIELPEVTMSPPGDYFDIAFMTRMLFSALVDADFLDTEQAMADEGPPARGRFDDIPTLYQKLVEHLKGKNWWPPQGIYNQKRCQIIENCFRAGKKEQGLYTLTVPTGGGKTIASLAFALAHARAHGLKRVVYVIPYTSIIEQTAQVFGDILGPHNVLEHHSNVDFDGRDSPETDLLRLAAENWDVPVVVTTSVQFFESLFGNRSGRCRKLHNLAKSVVIFDEAQMLPVDLLRPCVEAIRALVQHCHTTAVLCTATQPSLEKLFPPGAPITELCPDTRQLYDLFRRTTICDMGRLEQEQLAQRLASHSQALCIVNSRKLAQQIYLQLPPEGSFHLSTLMTPDHRRQVLEEIRQRLQDKAGPPCRVVATSLIEAGVDVDFPAVYRQEAGLDSIIQAAGRCNREGRRRPEESEVYVFSLGARNPDQIGQNIAILHEVQRCYRDIAAPDAIRAYFDQLHDLKGDALDKKQLIPKLRRLAVAEAARACKLIESDTRMVVIPRNAQARDLAQQLCRSVEGGFLSRELMRGIAKESVSIYPQHFARLEQAGDIQLLTPELAVLQNPRLYSDKTGLSQEAEYGKGIVV